MQKETCRVLLILGLIILLSKCHFWSFHTEEDYLADAKSALREDLVEYDSEEIIHYLVGPIKAWDVMDSTIVVYRWYANYPTNADTARVGVVLGIDRRIFGRFRGNISYDSSFRKFVRFKVPKSKLQ